MSSQGDTAATRDLPLPNGVPYVVMQVRPGTYSTFNMVPSPILRRSMRLLLLASVPLHLNLVPVDGGDEYLRPPYFHFQLEGEPFSPQQTITFRCLVVWASSDSAVGLAEQLLRHIPLTLLFITEDAALAADLEARYASRPGVGAVNVIDAQTGNFLTDTPQRIWRRHTELLDDALPGLYPRAWHVEPSATYTFAETLAAIDRGDFMPYYGGVRREPLSDDLIVRSNQILINFRLGKIPNWDFEREPAAPPAEAVRLAKRLLSLRTFHVIYDRLRALFPEGPPSSAEARGVLADPAPAGYVERAVRLLGTPREALQAEVASTLDGLEEDGWSSIFKQVILVCPSASLVPRTTIKYRTSHKGGYAITEVEEYQSEYGKVLLEAAAQGGRRLAVPPPQDEEQKRLLDGVFNTLRLETQYLSAVALFYASIFSCPVLKLERVGNPLFSAFKEVNAVFDLIDEGAAGQRAARHAEAARGVAGLSRLLASTLAPPYREFLDALGQPICHCFSDFPLELAEAGGDYLGYRSEMSRTPITPGGVSLTNNLSTSDYVPVPREAGDIILATPFAASDPEFAPFLSFLAEEFDDVATSFVRKPADLLDRLADERARCLVYFGHGYYDPVGDETGLLLENNILTSADLEDAGRVPPVVILVGCNTASASTVLGGLHSLLLEKGARMLVATTFPVEKLVGVDFLVALLRLMLHLPEDAPVRDMAEAVLLARRQIRAASDLLSLTRLGRLAEDDYLPALAEVVGEARRLAGLAGTGGDYWLEAERVVLHRRGLIPSPDTPPVEWGVIPYPLFFNLIGFPWTTLFPSFLSEVRVK